jgi:hypothetical protein
MPDFTFSRRRPFFNVGQCMQAANDKHSHPRLLDGEMYDEGRENYTFKVGFTGSHRMTDIIEGLAGSYPHLIRDEMRFKCEIRNDVTYLKSEEYKLNGHIHFDIIHRSNTIVGLFFPKQVLEGVGANPAEPISEGTQANL